MCVKYGELTDGWTSQPVHRFVGFTLGDGRRIRFWEDVWCSNGSLASLYLVLFQLAVNKDVMVSDCMETRNGGIQWNPTFVRSAHDWDL